VVSVNLDPPEGAPLFEQVAVQIRSPVDDGEAVRGDRTLPARDHGTVL
jgi:hypothetical protein